MQYLVSQFKLHAVFGATSRERAVTSGIPPGSILGPVLFLLYVHVNDLPKTVTASKLACFADDTKILKEVDSLPDTVDLQNDIDNINSWVVFNSLTFNQLKYNCQRITRKKTPVNNP
jgi:hypothetical protein